MFNKIVIAAAFASLIAAPAFAQSHKSTYKQDSMGSYAQAPSATDYDEVVVNGKVIGQDPDANVRLELRRDAFGENR
jgi:hypothetical protein